MQPLYDAIMALGRSYEDARTGGWFCFDLGKVDGPKCVNGLLTFHLTRKVGDIFSGQVTYISRLLRDNDLEAARVAAIALVKSRPTELDPQLLSGWPHDDEAARIKEVLRNPGAAPLGLLENVLVALNDLEDESKDPTPLLNSETASAWFERAFDLLAKGLPDPIPADPPLYVNEIIEAADEPKVLVEA